MITDQKISSAADDNDSGDEELVRVAKERFKSACEAEEDIRKAAKDDLEFSAGKQWDDGDLKTRKDDGRPSLVINRIPQFVRQISNDIRQNRPAVKVSPVDNKADVETAKVFSGMIRHIEYASNADTAYDTASDSAIRCGYGYFRIVTEFADPMSFEQEIKIKRVPDRFAVRLDPSYREPDGSDANWAFIEDEIAIEDFKALYPNAKASNSSEFEMLQSRDSDWFTKSHVRVTEYFYKEFKEVTICLLSTGDVEEESNIGELPEGVTIAQKRKTQVPIVKWAKLNGCEVLEKTEFTSRWIPVIPVLGEELIIEGKRQLSGVVRHAKDSQKMYNYFASVEAEAIALAPKAPWVGVEGQFEGHEAEWAQANRRNIPFLQYKPKSIGGQPAPPPQRNSFEPAVQAISNGRRLAGDDMKATTGIYDAGLGAQGQEKSGIAIQRRAHQSQTSNFHFVDNLSKSIRHCGRILVDMIPKVYDTARAVRTLGEDGSEDVVTINAIFEHPKTGNRVLYDLGAGKYDVTVASGPSYETKRQEAAASMLDMTRNYPPLMQIAGDLIAKSMDWQGADEIAKRLAKSLPPNLQDQPQGGQANIPPQVKAQLDQAHQMIDQLSQHLNQKTEQINTKALELESRERVALARIQADVEIALATMGHKASETLLEHQVAEIENRQSLLKFSQPIQAMQPQPPPQMQPQDPSMGQAPPQMPPGPGPQSNPVQQPTGGQSPGSPMGAP